MQNAIDVRSGPLLCYSATPSKKAQYYKDVLHSSNVLCRAIRWSGHASLTITHITFLSALGIYDRAISAIDGGESAIIVQLVW